MKKTVIKDKVKPEAKEPEVIKAKANIAKLIEYYDAEIKQAQNDREKFIFNQEKWYKKRYGIRPKKTFPWVGASNLHLPLQDKTVRKMKPIYVRVLENTNPTAEFVPTKAEAMPLAENCSWLFDWLVRTRMSIFPQYCLAADKTLSGGFSIAKVVYENSYEPTSYIILKKEIDEAKVKYGVDLLSGTPEAIQQFQTILVQEYGLDPIEDAEKMKSIMQNFIDGSEAVEFWVNEEIYNAPRLVILNPEDVVVASKSEVIFDFEGCRWIDHIYKQSVEDFLKDKIIGKWAGEAADEILRNHGVEDDNIQDKTAIKKKYQAEGQNRLRQSRTGVEEGDDCIVIHEVYCWYDEDNDGIEERHILNYCDECVDKELRFIRYPYPIKRWPFVKIPYEISTEKMYDTRGVVELIDPMATALNIQHNSKINRETLSTALMFWYVPSRVNPDNINFTPGQGIPVSSSDSFGVVQVPDVSFQYDKEEQSLKAWAEEYMAVTDYGMASPLNPVGTSKARTATEIQGIQMNSSSTGYLDIAIWKKAWQLIFELIWDLWCEKGPDEVWAYQTGMPKPLELTRTERSQHFNIIPAGNINTSDPQLEAQKAVTRYAQYMANPYIKKYELTRESLQNDDPRKVKALLVTPEEAKMIDQQMAQMAAMQAQQGQTGK